jgi:hypothetical protein
MCPLPLVEWLIRRMGDRNLDPIYQAIAPEVIKLPGAMITNAASNQSGVVRVAAAQALDGLDLEVMQRKYYPICYVLA